MRRGVAGALMATAAVLGCARPSSPPGGEQDRTPPRVVAVSPEAFDTLRDLRAPVVIRFDERLSIRLEGVQALEDAVIVSPRTGEVRVERRRRGLEVSLAGGWQRGLVYRVVVLPVFRDLFGNLRQEPIELVFTTGAPIPPTAVAGFLEDRITGELVAGGRVEATRRPDSIVYVAVSDTGGFFSLRNIPEGEYGVRAWLDRDRDRAPDFQEPQESATVRVGATDTVLVSLGLLPGDTTPARLVRAEPVDSMRVRLHFDDHFAPGEVSGSATLFRLPDSSAVAEVALIHGTALDSILARERAVADSLRAAADTAADAAAADTAADRAPPARARQLDRPPGRPGAAPGAARPGRGRAAGSAPLPSRELVAILPAPLEPGGTYVVEARGVTNIQGVPGGGGAARFLAPAPVDTAGALPGPEPPPPDTLRP